MTEQRQGQIALALFKREIRKNKISVSENSKTDCDTTLTEIREFGDNINKEELLEFLRMVYSDMILMTYRGTNQSSA